MIKEGGIFIYLFIYLKSSNIFLIKFLYCYYINISDPSKILFSSSCCCMSCCNHKVDVNSVILEDNCCLCNYSALKQVNLYIHRFITSYNRFPTSNYWLTTWNHWFSTSNHWFPTSNHSFTTWNHWFATSNHWFATFKSLICNIKSWIYDVKLLIYKIKSLIKYCLNSCFTLSNYWWSLIINNSWIEDLISFQVILLLHLILKGFSL